MIKFLKNIFGKQDKATIKSEKTKDIISTPEHIKSKEIINIDMPGIRLFEIGDHLHDKNIRFARKYLGGFIHTEGGILTLGICVKEDNDFEYKNDELITLLYESNEDLYLAAAKITDMRKAVESDNEISNLLMHNSEYEAYVKELFDIDETSNFIIADIIIMREPRRHQPRKHVRVPVNWDVSIRLTDPASDEKELIKTVDVSEGGFKSTVAEKIPKGTLIECDIEITGEEGEEIKTGVITATVINCLPNLINPEQFDLRVQFTDIPDSAKKILFDNIEKNIPPPVDAEAELTISHDKMEAILKIKPPKYQGNDLSREMFEEFLTQSGVVFGIDDEVLTELTKRPVYNRNIIVAHGIQCVNGEEADLTFHVEKDQGAIPKEDEYGHVDFKHLGLQQEVKKDALLCEKKPATEGINGTDVMGNDIIAKNGKDKPMPAGTNAFLSEDGLSLFAAMDGNVSFIRDKINIMNTYTVRGNVSYATGNIKFSGNVLVTGDVEAGFSVEATGDVIVNGVVEAANISAGGSLLIRGGFFGGKSGELDVAENATIRFIEGGTLTVKGNLETTYIINAVVKSDGTINLLGQGIIRGGHVSALTSVKAKFLGNEHSLARTIVEVGNAPLLVERYNLVCTEIESHKKENMEKAQTTCAELIAERDMLKDKIKDIGYGTITVEKTAYIGVRIIIGTEMLTLYDVGYISVKFVRSPEGIVFESIS